MQTFAVASVLIESLSTSLLAGTSQNLSCSVDSSVLATFIWKKDDSPVNTNDSRITVSSLTSTISTLQFNTLHTSDGGQYQCVATVMSGGNSANLTDEIDLNVTSKWNITSIIHHV